MLSSNKRLLFEFIFTSRRVFSKCPDFKINSNRSLFVAVKKYHNHNEENCKLLSCISTTIYLKYLNTCQISLYIWNWVKIHLRVTVPVTVMESMVVLSVDAGLFFFFDRVIAKSAVNTSEEKNGIQILF